jgi:hypothetical protein
MSPAHVLRIALIVAGSLGPAVFGQPAGGSTPRDHQVHSATSADGLTWTRDEGVRLTSASVPCAINDRDQRVLLYVVRPPDDAGGVGGVTCAVSVDGTNFAVDPAFRLEGLSTLTAADPSIVRDATGTFRLYYLASNYRGDPANEPNPHRINLALSEDGIRFREAGTVFTYDDLVDPDVFEYRGQWFMYVFGRGGTVIATSADGRQFGFNRVMSPPNWGTTAPVLLADGRLRLYAFEQRVPLGNAVGSFLSNDGLTWVAEPGQRLRANANEQITDPFVIPWRGGWKMYFKTSPALAGTGSARLTNLSVRARSGAGANVLIAGFTVAGSGAKSLLVRGVGPALIPAPFNLAGALADPRLELFAGPNRLAANDNWSADALGATAVAAAAARVGAFPLAMGSRDAAVVSTLPAGGYTVQVAGVGDVSGTALAEIYDADPPLATAGTRLSNISARTQVGGGGDVLIAGFTIAGTGSQRVLIRGIGPALARLGVAGSLADPRLEVFQGSTLVAGNDNWGGQAGGVTAANIQEATSLAGAFPLETNSRDAALLLALPPGGYTALVSGLGVSAGIALVEVYEVPPGAGGGGSPPPGGTGGGGGTVQVTAVTSSYRAAAGGLTGWLVTGQSADLMLSGFGFGESGGPLQFNHPRGIASDGTRLYVSDGHNNRVLGWLRAPEGNTPPDFALGQPTLHANVPGTGLHEMNWPGQVSVTPAGRVVVADTYNDRLLVWREAPVRSGQPADFEIRHSALRWPWGVWTDGTRLVASSTGGRAILVWSAFPAGGAAPPDFTLEDAAIGTPRTITSDGTFLMVGDHNANGSEAGNWVWRSFPTGARRYDFFLREPSDSHGPWMQGAMSADGRLVVLGRHLNVWNGVPAGATTPPALIVDGHDYRGGDGSGVAFALGRTYVVAYNDNRVTAYRALPTTRATRPDFAVGSPSLDVNTLATSHFITNGVPATDGARLYVSSDFDRTLSVWNRIPDESAARPDWLYRLPFAPWDNALSGDMLLLAGQQRIMGWRAAPRAGEMPDVNYVARIGPVAFQEIRGVALDAAYFYVGDFQAGRVHIWRGLPAADAEPAFSLEVPGVTRLSSDGTWLVATQTERQSVTVFEVARLAVGARGSAIGGPGRFNLPQTARVARGQLFIANTGFNQLQAWRRVEDAVAGRTPDVVLGDANPAAPPRITERTLFWPGAPAFDGSYLWVGEFKFSGRILRFSVR